MKKTLQSFKIKNLKKLFLSAVLTLGFTSTSFSQATHTVEIFVDGALCDNNIDDLCTGLTVDVGDELVIINRLASGVSFSLNTITSPTLTVHTSFNYTIIGTDVPSFSITTFYNNTVLNTIPPFPVYVNSSTPTGIISAKDDKIQFTAFPNPVLDILTIKAPINLETITVFSLTGQVVFSDFVKEIETNIDFTSLSAGTYIVRVGNSKKIVTKN